MSHSLSLIMVVWIMVISALALVAQEPTPTKKIQLSPSVVVEAYIKAIAANDLAALSKTYTRPLEGIYRSLAAFRAEHEKLVVETKKLFGKSGAAEVDDKRYNVTLPPIVSGSVGNAVIQKSSATVPVSFSVRGQKKPHDTQVVLELQQLEWRIVQVGAQRLPVPVRPEASIVEWEVAAEATKRILGFLSRNKVKAASDIVSLRKSYMQIVTKEWTLAQKLGKRPASHPTSSPPKRSKIPKK